MVDTLARARRPQGVVCNKLKRSSGFNLPHRQETPAVSARGTAHREGASGEVRGLVATLAWSL